MNTIEILLLYKCKYSILIKIKSIMFDVYLVFINNFYLLSNSSLNIINIKHNNKETS
jgi:hypothetical protein